MRTVMIRTSFPFSALLSLHLVTGACTCAYGQVERVFIEDEDQCILDVSEIHRERIQLTTYVYAAGARLGLFFPRLDKWDIEYIARTAGRATVALRHQGKIFAECPIAGATKFTNASGQLVFGLLLSFPTEKAAITVARRLEPRQILRIRIPR